MSRERGQKSVTGIIPKGRWTDDPCGGVVGWRLWQRGDVGVTVGLVLSSKLFAGNRRPPNVVRGSEESKEDHRKPLEQDI